MDVNWLSVVFRWMHILPAIVAVGGTIFMWAALHPATTALPEADRAGLREAVRSRWSKWVMGAILFLLVSGFYNFFTLINRYEVPKIYHMLFGIKFLLALAIFTLASFLTGRTPIAQRLRANAGPWLTLNVVLAVVLVCISGVMRSLSNHAPLKPTAAVQAHVQMDAENVAGGKGWQG